MIGIADIFLVCILRGGGGVWRQRAMLYVGRSDFCSLLLTYLPLCAQSHQSSKAEQSKKVRLLREFRCCTCWGESLASFYIRRCQSVSQSISNSESRFVFFRSYSKRKRDTLIHNLTLSPSWWVFNQWNWMIVIAAESDSLRGESYFLKVTSI